MPVQHLLLRTDFGSQAELTWDESRDPEALTLSVNSRSLWNPAELRQLARTLEAAADALESESPEWRIEMFRDAGFTDRKAERPAA